MQTLGKQISDDGETLWQNNGGITERKALYANAQWETVADPSPQTPDELKKYCEQGGYKYRRHFNSSL